MFKSLSYLPLQILEKQLHQSADAIDEQNELPYQYMIKMKYLYRHVIVWAIFIVYELSFVTMLGTPLSTFSDLFLHYGTNVVLFYLNAAGFTYIFEHKRQKYLFVIGLILLESGIYFAIQWLISSVLTYIQSHTGFGMVYTRRSIIIIVYRFVYITGASIGYWSVMSVFKQRNIIVDMENQRLKREKLNAELESTLVHTQNAYLKSQLNPHLLFNTLNFIYNSVRKLSSSAASAILLLSDMMRYSLSDTGIEGKVSLSSEVEHIRNFITLNQLRFGDALHINLQVNGSLQAAEIIPLVLISFVENMYKHGDLTDPQFPALIAISCQDNVLTVECRNKKNKVKVTEGWGIGIQNTRKRLASYYPDRFTLSIIEDETSYQLILNLQLQAMVPALV